MVSNSEMTFLQGQVVDPALFAGETRSLTAKLQKRAIYGWKA